MIAVVGSLVLADRIMDGWVLVDGGVITDIGRDEPATSAPDIDVVDASGSFILPGLVDIHCHGGGGESFDVSEASARAAARFHWTHGTTSVMASIGTCADADMLAQVRRLVAVVADGTALGIHLEGPYLSAVRRGAHPEHELRLPDLAELARLLEAGTGTVSMVTIAPELDGALAAIAMLRAAGVTVAVGHTDATFDQTIAAVDAGASVATHLFNGMRPIHHREGGPALASLGDDRVSCELICDGHHVSAAVCQFAYRNAGNERLVLVTDACAPAGMPDGNYLVGREPVVMSGGEIRTADGRSLAGSVLTMIAAVRFAVSAGVPLVAAVRAASLNGARTVGLHDRGALAVGMSADLLIADRSLAVAGVMRRGTWL